MGAIEKLENKIYCVHCTLLPAQSNILLLRDMLNTKDSSGNWVTLDTEEQLAIPAINELNAEMATKQDAISADNLLPAEYVSGLAAVATSGSYNDLTDVPVIPSMDDLATSAELTALQTALETSIAEKQDKGEYLVASKWQSRCIDGDDHPGNNQQIGRHVCNQSRYDSSGRSVTICD